MLDCYWVVCRGSGIAVSRAGLQAITKLSCGVAATCNRLPLIGRTVPILHASSALFKPTFAALPWSTGADDCLLMIAARQVRCRCACCAECCGKQMCVQRRAVPPQACPTSLHSRTALPTQLCGPSHAARIQTPFCHPLPPLIGAHPRRPPLRLLPASQEPPDHRALVRPALCAVHAQLRRRSCRSGCPRA